MSKVVLPISFSFMLLISMPHMRFTYSWHAYNHQDGRIVFPKSTNCLTDQESSKQLLVHLRRGNVMKLWNVAISLSKNPTWFLGKQMYGFYNAVYRIWRHQHPRNCSQVQYLISPGLWEGSGFGSEIHVDGAMLAIALQLGRVLVDSPYSIKRNITYKQDNAFCRRQGARNKECYYEPWSSCTVHDALHSVGANLDDLRDTFLRRKSGGGGVRLVNLTHDFMLTVLAQKDPKGVLASIRSTKVIVVDTPRGYQGYRKLVPDVVKELLRCSPVRREHWGYWWRAVAAAYMVRPNADTLAWLDAHRSLPMHGSCVSVYVRRGDKYREMKLVPLSTYLDVTQSLIAVSATTSSSSSSSSSKSLVTRSNKSSRGSGGDAMRRLHRSGTIQKNMSSLIGQLDFSRSRTVFFNSEDPSMLEQARQWAWQQRLQLLYTDVINRSLSSARLARTQHSFLENEYLTMILNLEYALRCDAWVCTLGSNYCRVIDEMRATVACKANFPYVDLSSETCKHPPCIGDGIKSFSW